MKESYWGYWLIILGIFVIVIMMLISNVTTTNTQDYYLIKEVTEASMVDSVDLAYYRTSGELKINKEKFVESFLRRFAANVALNTYQIDFYGLYEAPPKVSVKVTTKSASYTIASSSSSFDIINKVDAILDVNGVTYSSGVQDNSITPQTGSSASSDSSDTTDDTDEEDVCDQTPTASEAEQIFNTYREEFYDDDGKILSQDDFVAKGFEDYEFELECDYNFSDEDLIKGFFTDMYSKVDTTYKEKG